MTLIQSIIQKTKELLKLEEAPPAKPAPKPKPKPKPRPKPTPTPKPRPKTSKPPAPKPPTPSPVPTHEEGIDYSEGNGVTAQQIKNAGKHFVCRYLSHDPKKDINKQELWNLLNAGLGVVLVWETEQYRALGGKLAGIADGYEVKHRTESLGIGQVPCYFAVDFDAKPGDQGPINAYLSGAGQSIGLRRVGVYGGFYVVKRAFDAKVISYGWQTYAWSGKQWEPRAQLQQYDNGPHLGPAEVDFDRSTHKDFAQWPRP